MALRLDVGSIVWVSEFVYTDAPGGKTAPGVVLSSHRYHQEKPDVVVARITSKLHHASGFGAVLIEDWLSCGLDKPSVIKPVLMTVGQKQILRVVGKLDGSTLVELKRAFKSIFPFAS